MTWTYEIPDSATRQRSILSSLLSFSRPSQSSYPQAWRSYVMIFGQLHIAGLPLWRGFLLGTLSRYVSLGVWVLEGAGVYVLGNKCIPG